MLTSGVVCCPFVGLMIRDESIQAVYLTWIRSVFGKDIVDNVLLSESKW